MAPPLKRLTGTSRAKNFSSTSRAKSTIEAPVSSENMKGLDFGSVLNAASMVGGIAQAAGAKKPVQKKPTLYKSFIRPAKGNEQMVQRNMNEIAQNTGEAVKDVNTNAGSSIGANMAGRLAVLDKSNQAKADVLGQNAQIQINDQIRVDGQVNADLKANTDLKNAFDQQDFSRQYNEWLMKRGAANETIQSGIDYAQASNADYQNKGAMERSANQAVGIEQEKMIHAAYLEGLRQKMTPEQAMEYAHKTIDLSKYKTNNYQSPQSIFRKRRRM